MGKVFESKYFVLFLLFVLFFAEWLSFSYIIKENTTGFGDIYLCHVLTIWGFLIAVIIIGSVLGVYKLRVQIVKRFFNNALGMRWLSFVFVLTFLVHIALISNVCYAVLTSNQLDWYALFIPVVGIVFLCAIFPVKNVTRDKLDDKNSKLLLVSGITSISERNLNLLFKPFVNNSTIERMVIILTDGLYKQSEETRKRNICDLEKVLSGLNYSFSEIEQKKQEYETYILETKISRLKILLYEILERYYLTNYPQYPRLEVVLSQDYFDYNDFDSCYVGIGEIIKSEETKYKVKPSKTLIHISPGTAVITGVMSLYGIKAKRELLYTRQDNSELMSFDLNVWSVDELLNELWKELDE